MDLNSLQDLMKDLVNYKLYQKLTIAVEKIKGIIIDTYDTELTNVVSVQDSKVDPKSYLVEFIDRLDKFDYIHVDKNGVSIDTPDEDNFDFSGRLRIIEVIIHGLSGTYVEMDSNTFISTFDRSPLLIDVDENDSGGDNKIYLVRYNDAVKSKETESGKKFTKFPFSNMPPVDIFKSGNDFVLKNINKWIDESIEEAQIEFVSNVQRSKLNEL